LPKEPFPPPTESADNSSEILHTSCCRWISNSNVVNNLFYIVCVSFTNSIEAIFFVIKNSRVNKNLEKMFLTDDRAQKKMKYDNNQLSILQTLSRDEWSHILNYLPVKNKVMLFCSSKVLFQLIDNLVREQVYAYDSTTSLSTILCKYNEYKIKTGTVADIESKLNELKVLLEKSGSFSGVTQKLLIDYPRRVAREDEKKLESTMNQLIEILSTSTSSGRNVSVSVIEENAKEPYISKTIPETMGHTLKHFELNGYSGFNFELLRHICKLESLKLQLFDMPDLENVPELENTYVLSELKHLEIDCDITEEATQYFTSIAPNIEILITGQRDGFQYFADNCPKLRDITFNRSESAFVSDSDVLYFLEHLPELRKLSIISNSFNGSAFSEMGKFAKKLEYLRIDRCDAEDDKEDEYGIGGGQLPALKQFKFGGELYLEEKNIEERYDVKTLYDSIIANCPAIENVVIDEAEYIYFPSNLYGLVPVQQVTDLLLFSPNSKQHGVFDIPGTNATDVITNEVANWKEIAQSEHVKILTMFEIPPVEVLKRCKWNNAHTLRIKQYCGGLDTDIEWFNCLVQACPNIRYLYLPRMNVSGQYSLQALCDTAVWPDLLVVSNLLNQDNFVQRVLKVRPQLKLITNERQRRESLPWELQWLQEEIKDWDVKNEY
jgi:hypothetical protein